MPFLVLDDFFEPEDYLNLTQGINCLSLSTPVLNHFATF